MDKIGKVDSNETKNFVAVIVKREAMKIYDKRKKRGEIPESELDYENENGGTTSFFEKISSKDSGTMVNEVEEAIKALPYRHSSLMTLKYVFGYSGKEIAEITGLSEVNIRQQLFKARKMLEEMLE